MYKPGFVDKSEPVLDLSAIINFFSSLINFPTRREGANTTKIKDYMKTMI